MTYDCEITLISYEIEKDDIGDTIEVEIKRPVLASKIDYRSKDYYQALQSGLKPSITFAINKHEYQNEKDIEFEGNKYRIIDVYPITEKHTNEFEGLALLCEGVI